MISRLPGLVVTSTSDCKVSVPQPFGSASVGAQNLPTSHIVPDTKPASPPVTVGVFGSVEMPPLMLLPKSPPPALPWLPVVSADDTCALLPPREPPFDWSPERPALTAAASPTT